MNRPILRIAIAQINPTVGDFKRNAAKILDAAAKARSKKASLVLFPELCITGYPPEDLIFKKHFVSSNLDCLDRIRQSLAPGITAVIGFIDRGPRGEPYNAAAVVQGRVLRGVYRKICLPNYGVFDEKRYFSKGNCPLILQTPHGSVAVSICEDLWPRPSPYMELLEGLPINVLLNLSASPYHYRKQEAREALMKSRAVELGATVVYANLVGGQDELVFDGSSLVIDPRGNKIAGARRFREDLVLADIPMNGAKSFRHDPKRVTVQKIDALVRLVPRPAQVLDAARSIPERPDPVAEIYEALCLGTKDYVQKNRFSKVVIGASGGIDSAIVAAIAADAIGPQNVILVTMPSRFNSKATRGDAEILARNLKTRFLEIPIDGLMKAYLAALKRIFRASKPGAAEENIQARIRGNLLMALSNKFGYLVLTTGNKSELATGYCTLYGDMAGGFAVIKDVPKMTVYELCRYRNALEKRAVIPESIITRVPSAELRANQKDTDSLPEYPTLDAILEAYVENDASTQDILAKGFDPKSVRDVIRRVDLNEYKRRQAAPGIKITPKAFGRDRRMPITNAFSR